MIAGTFKVKIIRLAGRGGNNKLIRARTPCPCSTNIVALHVEAQWAVSAKVRWNNFTEAE
jgi:hypothetical protein